MQEDIQNNQPVKIGRKNRLRIVSKLDFGFFLDGGESGEILLPIRYVPEGCEIDDIIEVFIYLDSEDRLIATTETPYAMEGDLTYLKVISVNQTGAFLDWGLPKDLLVPFREQKRNMREDRYYLVYIYLDESSNRLAASAKIHKYIQPHLMDFQPGENVDLIIGNKFELGYNVVINKSFPGVIYDNEIFQNIKTGQKVEGYIKKIRSDDKIDAALQKPGGKAKADLTDRIIQMLQSNDGHLAISDKSPPEDIYKVFQVSKKAFKQAVGALYKQRLIQIESKGIRLV